MKPVVLKPSVIVSVKNEQESKEDLLYVSKTISLTFFMYFQVHCRSYQWSPLEKRDKPLERNIPRWMQLMAECFKIPFKCENKSRNKCCVVLWWKWIITPFSVVFKNLYRNFWDCICFATAETNSSSSLGACFVELDRNTNLECAMWTRGTSFSFRV